MCGSRNRLYVELMPKRHRLLELAASADLVEREVHAGSRDAVPTTIAVARRIYATDQPDLWDAVTNAERIKRWFAPISGDLKVGGHYQLQDNASGTVEQCREPESFSATWEFDGGVSWIGVHLTPGDGGTVLELRHESPFDSQAWDEYGPGAQGVGWELSWLALDRHLASPSDVDDLDQEWAEAFPTTDAGVGFVRRAALGWAEAAIVYGDSKDQAYEAAERTIAFYTTEPGDSSEA